MVHTCAICMKPAADGQVLCPYHQKAYVNLREKCENWKKALGISWEEYLRVVLKNPNSGDWVKELCGYLLSRNSVDLT